MSLMQLLAMGKSIRTIEDRPTPYKVREQNMVPKFRSTVWPTMKQLEAMSRPRVVVASGGATTVMETITPERTQVDEPKPPTEAVERYARPAYPLGRWTASQKPSIWANRHASAQGELGLEGVRVIRNDLQDADLELVAEKASWPTAVEAEADRSELQPLRVLKAWLDRVKRAH